MGSPHYPCLELELEIVELGTRLGEASVDRLRRIVPFVLGRERQTGNWAVTVVLTDDQELRRLHREFMSIDEETDVMTFPFSEGEAGGEIAVSVERAADQGPDHGLTTGAEVEFLVVHGLLHLCGWDDQEPGAREQMLARQQELIAAFDLAERSVPG